MKALFLDVDGVLNYARCKYRAKSGAIGIDPAKVKLLHRIIKNTGCVVVLSSTWRIFPDWIAEVEEHVKLYGCTPRHNGCMVRGKEIQEYLEKHPEITHYAIVDDDSDMLPEQLPNFFQTSFFKKGLTAEIANNIIQHLNTK